MSDAVDVQLFFNFRSPYCYIASKTMFTVFDDYRTRLLWHPLGGWNGRSPPERAQLKRPIARQDVARIARRLGIPLKPPPAETDPTRAAAGSLLAEERGLLRPYIVEAMRAEWANGRDIGHGDVLREIGNAVGLDASELEAAIDDPARHAQLERNWEEARRRGAMGVPTFIIGEEIFWGQDRIDYVEEHLRELRARRL